jgi:glycosyltransferase involved in cell wall biosynthesis
VKHLKTDHIYFDARFIRYDHHDGISRFSAGLFAALSRRTRVTAIIHDTRQLLKLPRGCDYILANDPTSISELFIARTLNKAGAKIVFSPMQTMGSWFRRYKLILTLHDLIYYRHPAPPPEFNWLIRTGWRLFHMVYWPQRLFLNRADAVATVSKTSMRLMLEHRLTTRPISVIYNAAGTFGEEEANIPPKVRPRDGQRLVYMGSFMDYKNVEVLIDGMQHLPEYELHLLSRVKPERKSQLEARIKPGSGKVVFHDGVSEDEYHRQLDQAVALVTGSRDEGFGIPLIESMSRGVPVVVSDIEIFKEIGGDAALFFDQEDPKDFAQQVRKLESNPVWLDRGEASIRHAEQFNWDRSAGDLIEMIAGL